MHKKYLPLLVAVAVLVGAGCRQTSLTKGNAFPETPPWPRTGTALVGQALVQDGPSIIATDALTGRQFTSVLPPTFTDGNGNYTTPKNDELVDVQVAIGGTPAQDHNQFTKISSLEQLSDQDVNGWQVTTAFDTQHQRWVARAAQADSVDGSNMYHVIECLSTSTSNATFWDGCRTIIAHASVVPGIAGSGSSPTP